MAVVMFVGALMLSGCFAGSAGDDGDDRLSVGMAFQPVADMSPYSDDAVLLSKIGATETLVVLDREGKPAPALAESWRRTDSGTVRLTLREGVTFHDGTRLSAEHAAAALNHAADATTPPRALNGVDLTAQAVDQRTLEVSTGKPDPILVRRLTAPALAILAPTAYDGESKAPNPVGAGTGPYSLDSVRGDSAAKLSAHANYWGGRPKNSGVDVRFIPDGASRANALRAGEVDVIDNVPVSQLPTISEQRVLEFPLPRLVGAHLNTSEGPFTDPALRATAREAIDTKKIVEGVYAGHADPARGLFGPASPWARSSSQRDETQPGKPRGRAITVATYEERPELAEIASVIAENLRSAGFRVRDVIVQRYSTMESELLAGAYDLVIGSRSYSLDTGDPISYLRTDWTCDGSYNLSQFCDPRIDAAVAEAESAGPDEREKAANRIAARVLSSDAIVPIAHERTRIGVAGDVGGVARDSFERKLITAKTTRT